MSAHGFGRSPQRLIRDRRVPPHHPFGLPATKRHDNRRGEALVERHRRAVVSEIVEMEVAEPHGAGGLPENPADVHAAVGAAIRAWEYPVSFMPLELAL